MTDRMAEQQFARLVTLSPAFDRRHPEPSKNYGIHGVDMRMVLKGPLGATQFVLYTNWHLPHIQSETDDRILRKSRENVIGRRVRKVRVPADTSSQAIKDLVDTLEVAPRAGLNDIDLKISYHPMPADLGYHWITPQYEGQQPMDCEYVAGGKCYYDDSGLNAKRIFDVLLRDGSDGVWRELEAYYRDIEGRINE